MAKEVRNMFDNNEGMTDMVTHMFDNITGDDPSSSSKDQGKGSMTVKEAGKKGGEARKKQIKNDPHMSYEKLGRMGGTAAHRDD